MEERSTGIAFDGTEHSSLTVQHGGGSIIVWCGAAVSGTGNIAQVYGRVNISECGNDISQEAKAEKRLAAGQ